MKRLNVKNFYEFYQFPKVLVKSPKYRTMSDAAKIIYMLLLNRLTDSLMENNIDIDSDQTITKTSLCPKFERNKIICWRS